MANRKKETVDMQRLLFDKVFSNYRQNESADILLPDYRLTVKSYNN